MTNIVRTDSKSPLFAQLVRGHGRDGLTVILFLLLLSLAAYVRFYRLEYSFIGGDQSILVGIAAKFVRQGEIPLAANKSSAGIMNPPFLEYLLAFPLFIQSQILGVVQFTALINLAAVIVCYAFVARLWGRRAAFIAALFFAANPWAVYYSRLIWNPTPIPLFSTLLSGSLLAYFAGARRSIWLALSFLCLAVIIQLHLASLVLILLVGLIFLVFRRALRPKPMLGGVVLFFLTFAPFCVFIRGTGFTDLQAVLEALQGGEAVHFNLSSALLARDLSTGNGIFAAVAQSGSRWREAVWPWFGLMRLQALMLLCSLIYGVAVLIQARREFVVQRFASRTATWLILLLWLVFPTLMYLRHGTYLQNYYFLYLYPAPFILMALFIDDVWGRLSRAIDGRLRWGLKGLVLSTLTLFMPVLIGAIALWQFHIFFVRLDLTPRYGFDGRPVQSVDRLIAVSRELMAARPGCDLMVLSEGDRYETSSLGLLSPFLSPISVRYLQKGNGLILPEKCAVYVVADQDPWTRTWLEGNAAQLTDAVIDSREGIWHFYEASKGAREKFRASIGGMDTIAEWENGVALRQVQVSPQVQPGELLEVTYVWEITANPPQPYYHFFNHLLSQTDGQLIAQKDGPGVYSLYWRKGDLVVTRFRIPIPTDASPGAGVLRTGLYTWPDVERVLRDTGEDGLTAAVIQIQ